METRRNNKRGTVAIEVLQFVGGVAKMLAPPPNDPQSSLDATALEPEGKRQYLLSLGKKIIFRFY